jgi:hypothetical protein
MLGSHDEQWSRYKRLQWAWCISFLSFFPVLAIAGLIATQIFQKRIPDTASGVFVVLWFLSSAFLDHLFTSWPCPRCGRPFVSNGNWTWWTNNCVHCGLSKYSDPLNPTDIT